MRGRFLATHSDSPVALHPPEKVHFIGLSFDWIAFVNSACVSNQSTASRKTSSSGGAFGLSLEGISKKNLLRFSQSACIQSAGFVCGRFSPIMKPSRASHHTTFPGMTKSRKPSFALVCVTARVPEFTSENSSYRIPFSNCLIETTDGLRLHAHMIPTRSQRIQPFDFMGSLEVYHLQIWVRSTACLQDDLSRSNTATK